MKYAVRLLLVTLSLCLPLLASAQRDSLVAEPDARLDWDTFVERYSELSADELSDEAADRELMYDLYELHCNPLNLNDVDEEQLRRLPFLDETAILSVLSYVKKYRPLLSTGELMYMHGLDYPTRRLLQLFCRAGDMPKPKASPAQLLSRPKQEITLRADEPFYTKVGFSSYSPSYLQAHPNAVYRGDPSYLSLRYTINFSNRLEAGLIMEKDAGERGVDYWGAYALLHGLGRLRTLAVGNYRAQFGFGLVMNTSFGFGKLMSLTSLDRMDRGFRRHSSVSESNYLRGVAATVQLTPGVQLSAFASGTDVDGTFRADSTGISSLKTDGLHRTALERSKKGNVGKLDFGGNIGWQAKRLRLSLTAVYTHLDHPLRPVFNTKSTRYRRYNAAGNSFGNYSLSYRYVGRRWAIGGETALGQGGGLASLAMAQGEVGGTKLTLIGRHYQARYVTLNGHSFSENSNPQNESGIYLGASHSFSKQMQLEGFVDFMHFPWLKYQVSDPSWGIDALVQASYRQGIHGLNLRWRTKTKQRDVKINSDGATALHWNTVHSLRLSHTLDLRNGLSLRTQLLGAAANRADLGTKWGYGVGEQVGWGRRLRRPLLAVRSRRLEQRLRVSFSLTYFHTDDYASRLYTYEPSLLYSYGMRTFYGEGVRGLLVAQLPLFPGLDFIAKAATVRYFDRETIGTGLEQTLRDHREDVQLQVRFRF